jgi:hypothetical protein
MGIVGGAPAAPIGGPPPGIVVGGPPPGIVGGPPAGGLAIAVAPPSGARPRRRPCAPSARWAARTRWEQQRIPPDAPEAAPGTAPGTVRGPTPRAPARPSRVRGEARQRRRRREAPRPASSVAEVRPEEHRPRRESLLRGCRSRGPRRRIASRAGWEEAGSDREARARRWRHARVRLSRGCGVARARRERDARSLARPIERPRETNTPSIVSPACRFADDGAAAPSPARRASGHAGRHAPFGAFCCPYGPGG